MSLVQCKECGHDVSERAYECPNCGAILKKPKRGIIGKIFLWLFIIFNVLMAILLYNTLGDATDIISQTENEYAQVGATIGTAFGVWFVIGLWACVDIILGLFVLFTKPSKK